MKCLSKACLALCCVWFSTDAFAETFRVGFYNYPPMMIEDGRQGIYQDIFDELGKLTGDRFQVSYYPYPRISLLFNDGKLDIEPGVHPGWVRGQATPGLFSVPFGKVIDTLMFAPGKAFAVKRAQDLRGKSVGMVRGYAYPELSELLESGQLKRHNGANEEQLLGMLAKERFDQIIINKAVAQYQQKQVATYRQLQIGDVISTYDVSLRVHPQHADALARIDAAILQLKQRGVIERIYAGYGVRL